MTALRVRASVLGLSITCLAVPAALLAQAETPQVIAEQYVAATAKGDWGRMAGLMHPTALRQVHDLLGPLLRVDGPEGDQVRSAFFGTPDKAVAAAASDSAFFTGLIRFVMAQQAGLADIMRSARYHYLGYVPEGPDTVHVVGRVSVSVEGSTVSQIEVLPLMRMGTGWRALLKADFAQLVQRLRAMLPPQR